MNNGGASFLIPFIDDQNAKTRSVIREKFNEFFQKQLNPKKDEQKIEPLTHKDIALILKIMHIVRSGDDKTDKELHQNAKQVLKNLLGTLAHEEILNLTEQEFSGVDVSVAFIPLLHKVLSRKMDEKECDFVIKCIEMGIAISITRDGKIIFEGRKYGPFAKDCIAKITQVALKEGGAMAEQYIGHTPIVSNSGSAIKVAAGDFKEVKSLFSEKIIHELNYLATYIKSEGENYILIEKRGSFGDIELWIHKGSWEQKCVHPQMITEELKKQLFPALKDKDFDVQVVEIGEDEKEWIMKKGGSFDGLLS